MIKKYSVFLISLLGGALYASGFPMAIGHSFLLGPLLGFLLFHFALTQYKNLKEQLLVALFYSLGFYLLGFYWIPHLLQEFGGLTPPFNYLLGLFFSLLIIPQVYFYVFLKRKLRSIVLLAFLYTLLEIIIPQQFPAHLGHTFISLVPHINLKMASIFGAPYFTFLTAVIVLGIIAQSKKHIFLGILLFALNFIPYLTPESSSLLPPLFVRIVQPNIGNFMKVDSEKGGALSQQSVFQNYFELSTAPSSKPLDLIVWPETSFPTLLSSDLLTNNQDNQIPSLLHDIISKSHSELFIGGYDLKSETSRYQFQSEYNTAFHFDRNSRIKNVYHKIHLIPFGEGLPFGPLNEFLSQYITNVSFFAEGETKTLFHLENQTPFVSAICYEILFPQFIRTALLEQNEEPQFLINLTNDSWYGDTAEPYQHLFLAKWRAIEFNLPIIRSTNTGISTIIYADGSESDHLKIGEKSFMDIAVQLKKRTATLYERFGYLNLFILVFILIAVERILLLKGRANG